MRDSIREKIQVLQSQIDELEASKEAIELLQEIWLELGPYTPHLSNDLRYKLQDFFKFDDSE
jgi:hypothetical protein